MRLRAQPQQHGIARLDVIAVPEAVPQKNSSEEVPSSRVKQVYPEREDPAASVPVTKVIEVAVSEILAWREVVKLETTNGIVAPKLS